MKVNKNYEKFDNVYKYEGNIMMLINKIINEFVDCHCR